MSNVHPLRPPAPIRPSVSIFTDDGQIRKLDEIELDVICLALLLSKGCVTQAAVQLGIGRSTLYRKLPELEAARRYSPTTLV
jgi:transcriptional regulator of acetoin/glycerol metabolism